MILQSTYENFRYQYPSQNSNPYNKGVIENFMEVFFTSIPPSKNKFREKVQKEPEIQPRVIGGSFSGPNMEKPTGDIEAGRKPVSEDSSTVLREVEGDFGNDDRVNRHSEFAEEFPDLNILQGRSIMHPRRSSSGGRSRSLEIPPDVVAMASEAGHSNRVSGGDNGSS